MIAPIFARLVDAIRPWLKQLVFVGGWAHQLYRLHALASIPPHQPLRTRDADLAFSANARLPGDIGAALRAADFREELSGEHTPPVSEYRLGDENQGFYVEFLAPLSGSGAKRGGAADATLAKAGVTAQKLRYLEVLLIGPWSIQLGRSTGFPLRTPVNVRVANPVSFIAQKLLIRGRRKHNKVPQDVLYIHDTLELFGRDLEALRAVWLDQVRPTLAPRTVRNMGEFRREQYGDVTDAIRTAARIPQDRDLDPDGMRAACAFGLDAVFGSS